MGVSLSGREANAVSLARSAVVALLTVAAAASWLYAPPFLPAVARAAHSECNALNGSDYRGYHLAWRTVAADHVTWPHWECTSTRTLEEPASLGWWVAP